MYIYILSLLLLLLLIVTGDNSIGISSFKNFAWLHIFDNGDAQSLEATFDYSLQHT